VWRVICKSAFANHPSHLSGVLHITPTTFHLHITPTTFHKSSLSSTLCGSDWNFHSLHGEVGFHLIYSKIYLGVMQTAQNKFGHNYQFLSCHNYSSTWFFGGRSHSNGKELLESMKNHLQISLACRFFSLSLEWKKWWPIIVKLFPFLFPMQ
jgi:hypothetical protein